MKKEDKERLFLSEVVFLERWAVQFELDSDSDVSIKRMQERIGWLNKQLKDLASHPEEQDRFDENCKEDDDFLL